MTVLFSHRLSLLLLLSLSYTLIAEKSGLAIGTGDNSFNQMNCPDAFLTDIACGGNHVVGITEKGKLVAWGDNKFGQTNCPAGDGYTAIAAGNKHSVAIRNGSPIAWGSDFRDQTKCPKNISGLIDISSRLHFTIGLKSDGTIVG